MRRFAIALVFFAAMPFIAACSSTDHQVVKTGLFNDDLSAMNAAYDQVQVFKTTAEDLKQAGFNFNASNVRVIQGVDAMKALFGEGVFQGAINEKTDLKELLKKVNPYKLVIIPYQDVLEESEGLPLFGKDTSRTGPQQAMYFILHEDMVIYGARNNQEFNEFRFKKDSAVDGVGDVLKKIPQPPRIPGVTW